MMAKIPSVCERHQLKCQTFKLLKIELFTGEKLFTLSSSEQSLEAKCFLITTRTQHSAILNSIGHYANEHECIPKESSFITALLEPEKSAKKCSEEQSAMVCATSGKTVNLKNMS